MKTSEKIELTQAAQAAGANPVAEEFWAEVGDQLDRIDAERRPKVEARLTKEP